jgi:hypothetical protein
MKLPRFHATPTVRPPSIVVSGVGCEFDEPCGDDGNGTGIGVGYFMFSHHYCWFNFAFGDFSCYAEDTPPLTDRPNLFISWERTLSSDVKMKCSPSGKFGRLIAYYSDPAQSLVGTKFFAPASESDLDYDTNFPSVGAPSLFPARIESDWFQFSIPLTAFKIAVCNHAES